MLLVFLLWNVVTLLSKVSPRPKMSSAPDTIFGRIELTTGLFFLVFVGLFSFVLFANSRHLHLQMMLQEHSSTCASAATFIPWSQSAYILHVVNIVCIVPDV
jgi:hypothetical protein